MVVAIDGPGGVGKSSVSRLVATRLRWPHLDTGATYRAWALAALRERIRPDDVAALVRLDPQLEYEDGRTHLDGEDVSEAIRSEEVTAAVSEVSSHPELRARLVAFQRRWVEVRGGDAVVEGRDIGTVVFPEAPVKVFLTARPEIRAARRARETGEAVAKVLKDLIRRDRADSGRLADPLRRAPDAVVIDTSEMTVEEVCAGVLGLVAGARAGERPTSEPGS